MALVIVVACTHFYVAANEDTEWRQFLSTLPEDSKLLYNMVSDFHGGKLVCVRKRHLITNQDDQIEFICKETQIDKSARVGLVAATALKTQSIPLIYHQDSTNNMTGLCKASSADQRLWRCCPSSLLLFGSQREENAQR
jgi:hypothetical protein